MRAFPARLRTVNFLSDSGSTIHEQEETRRTERHHCLEQKGKT
jgi:hypothetical protein